MLVARVPAGPDRRLLGHDRAGGPPREIGTPARHAAPAFRLPPRSNVRPGKAFSHASIEEQAAGARL